MLSANDLVDACRAGLILILPCKNSNILLSAHDELGARRQASDSLVTTAVTLAHDVLGACTAGLILPCNNHSNIHASVESLTMWVCCMFSIAASNHFIVVSSQQSFCMISRADPQLSACPELCSRMSH